MKKILFGSTGAVMLAMAILAMMFTGYALAEEAAVVAEAAPAVAADPFNISAFLKEYWVIISTTITIASVVANSTPNDSDNKAVAMLDKIFGIFAMNFNVKGVSAPLYPPADKAKV